MRHALGPNGHVNCARVEMAAAGRTPDIAGTEVTVPRNRSWWIRPKVMNQRRGYVDSVEAVPSGRFAQLLDQMHVPICAASDNRPLPL